jgi:hypothetical protein
MRTITLNIPEELDLDTNQVVTLVASQLYKKANYRLGKPQNFLVLLNELLQNC